MNSSIKGTQVVGGWTAEGLKQGEFCQRKALIILGGRRGQPVTLG